MREIPVIPPSEWERRQTNWLRYTEHLLLFEACHNEKHWRCQMEKKENSIVDNLEEIHKFRNIFTGKREFINRQDVATLMKVCSCQCHEGSAKTYASGLQFAKG